MTTARSTAVSPPAKTNRYCDLSPLHSTELPAPLFTGYSMPLEEEGTQDGGGHDQEDTREEPAGGGLRGVGVTAGELAVGLDAAHQSQHGADGVAQLGGGVEIRGHEAGCLVDTGKALALRESVGGNHRAHHGKKDSSLHCRIVWVRHKFEFDGEDKWC